MIKTFTQLVSEAYDNIKQSSTNSTVSNADMKNYVNQGYMAALDYAKWQFLNRETTLSLAVTTLSAAASEDDTSITVTSNSGFLLGQKIMVYSDASTFDLVEITSLTSTDTIGFSPALDNDYDSGDSVMACSIFLPWNCRHNVNLYTLPDAEGNFSFRLLEPFSKKDFRDKYKYINTRAKQPLYYVFDKQAMTRIPSSGTLTAEADTNAQNVKYSAVTYPDETFAGWQLVNTNIKLSSRVRSYNSSTIKLYYGLEGQAVSDTFYLEQRLHRILIYPTPQVAVTLRLEYVEEQPYLYNDYDVPVLPDNFHESISLYAAYMAFSKMQGYRKNAELMLQQFTGEMERMKAFEKRTNKRGRIEPERRFIG